MAVSTSTSSPFPLLFLHRAAGNPSPTALSLSSSLRASPSAPAPPPQPRPPRPSPTTKPPTCLRRRRGQDFGCHRRLGMMGSSCCLVLLPGKETVARPCAQLHSSFIDSFSISQEKIVITNSYGEKLVGVLHEAGSKDIVVLCHGFRSSKESRTILGLTDALTSEKISVFRFDFAGNGESEGTFQYGNYSREVGDLRDVILHFKKRKCDTRAIAGHSKGGNVVILYASMYRDVSSVINMSGRFDLKCGIGDRLGNDYMERINQHGFIDVGKKTGDFIYRVTKESLMDRLKTDMQSACISIDPNCRVLTVHGSDDDVVPSEDALEFHKYISNHELHIIEGAGHRYTSHQLKLVNIVLKFVKSG